MPETIRLTPGRTNVSRAEFLVTLRAMHAAKWGRRRQTALEAACIIMEVNTMERRDQVLRFHCTPALMNRIEREAARRHLKIHEIARVAIAEGLRVLFGDEDRPALSPETPTAPEPVEADEPRRLTPDEVAEVERLRRESASHWTWKRLGERYGTTGYAVKMSVLGMERQG